MPSFKELSRLLYPFYSILFALLSPRHWVRNYGCNTDLDRILCDLIDSGEEFTNIRPYSAHLGPYKLWTANYPFATFNIYDKESLGLPRRLTVHRLQRLLMKSLKKDENCFL